VSYGTALLPFLIVAGLAGTARAGAQAPSPARPTLEEWQAQEAATAKAAKEAADKDSKMAAVSKVVDLLESLRSKILEEGEEEAKAYNTFACFCKDTSAEKSGAIQSGTDEANNLLAKVNQLSSKRIQLDTDIADFQGKIKKAEDDMEIAHQQRAAELKQYTIEEADLAGAVHALVEAIGALKASRPMTFTQMEKVKKTIFVADAMGFSTPRLGKVVSFLAESRDVPTENYKFHSEDIITTLEGLLKDFRDEKDSVDQTEAKAVAAHKIFIQTQTDLVKGYTTSLEQAISQKAATQEEMEVASQDFSGVKATLQDDKQYLAELTSMCGNRAKTWDQRSTLRQAELQALTEAMDVVKGAITEKTSGATVRLMQGRAAVSEAALTAIEAEVEKSEAPSAKAMSFLQKVSVKAHQPDEATEAVLNLLRTSGRKIHSSALTSLATQIADDPFAKVKALIQELLDRLLSQQNNEANQKGWCDKAISAAELKRDQAAEEVARLNGGMATVEAQRNKLADRLEVLASEISELKAKQAEAQSMRTAEALQNQEVIADASTGLTAVEQAIEILEKFYKTAAVAEVSFEQASKGPEDDAPAVFEGGEAYKGAQGEAFGVLGMLDVIKGDFKRTISETTKAEAQAVADFNEFMTETGKSLAEKNTAEGQATKLMGEAVQKLSDDDEALTSQTGLLTSAIKELIELQPACVNTGMTYQDRVANREQEIAALKQALCILGSYQQYGPTGVPTECFEAEAV